MTAQPKDYYAVLQAPQTATLDEIRAAFRKRAKELHPDVNQESQSHRQFQELQEAYAVLVSPEKRCLYDADIHLRAVLPDKQVDAAHCDGCNATSEHLRFVECETVFSFLLVSF